MPKKHKKRGPLNEWTPLDIVLVLVLDAFDCTQVLVEEALERCGFLDCHNERRGGFAVAALLTLGADGDDVGACLLGSGVPTDAEAEALRGL